MRIGELAQRSGLTASRIRFYESSGLIQAVERRANGYRDYGPEAEWMLEIITGAQAAGFSLDEIRQLLPEAQLGWQHDDMVGSLKRKVAEIELLQQRLERNRTQLLLAIETIERGPQEMSCDARAQWVLQQLREARAGEAAT